MTKEEYLAKMKANQEKVRKEGEWGVIGMKDYILTETGKVIPTNGGKIIIEDGYVYIMSFSTSKMTKEKIIAESDDPEEFNKINCKLTFCPSNRPKFTENDRGILRRINPKLEEKETKKHDQKRHQDPQEEPKTL